ncbi:uncharacterized protein LOC132572176 [Heteronotia binoei]|uniref:uncharacterized protein LOC132572176 n=1 Tax=Heteronotia binoei TaxID=13085 RepID=UPI00292CA71B|nr:uncharacterized protein LOC132572176 [Heteronotia binoei]
MEKHDSSEPEPWRRSLEGGRETHHTQVGSQGNLQMSPSPEETTRPNEAAQSSRELSLQEHLSTVDFPPPQQGNSEEQTDLLWDSFGRLQISSGAADDSDQLPGGQWAAESMPGVSGECPEAQRSSTTSGTEGTVERFPILVELSEVQEMLEGMSLGSLFPDLSPLDPLEMEIEPKGDGEASCHDQRIELENSDSAEPEQTPPRRSLEGRRETPQSSLEMHDSAEPQQPQRRSLEGGRETHAKLKKHDSAEHQQMPQRRSLEIGRETLQTEVGYPGNLQKSPSPRKIRRTNEDLQPSRRNCRNLSFQESLTTVTSPQAKQDNSQVAQDCFEGFQPGGQSATESMAGVSGEAPGAQRFASSGTKDIAEHFPISVEQSQPKVPELLEERLLKMEVKAEGDGKAGLKDQRIELENSDSAEPEQTPPRRSLEGRRETPQSSLEMHDSAEPQQPQRRSLEGGRETHAKLKKHDSGEHQQMPQRRSLEIGRETLQTEVGYPGNLQKSPSPRKIRRTNEDLQPSRRNCRNLSFQESLTTVTSPQTKQDNSQVAQDCFEGFQPGGQSATESMAGVSGEAPGAQRFASSGTKDIAEHFPISVEQSQPKVPELLEERLLKMEVKAEGDGKAGLKGVGPVSNREEDNLCLRRPEQSSQTQASPHGEMMTFEAAEMEEAPGIQ